MGNSEGLIEIESPEIPDQTLEAFASGLNSKPLGFCRSYGKLDASSPLAYFSSLGNKENHYAESFVGRHTLGTPQRGSYLVLGRMQNDEKSMGNFWNLNPLASSSTLSGRMGSAMLPDFGNAGTHAIWILVPPKIKLFSGVTAPQLGENGHWVPGGDSQYFLWKEVGVLLREATLTLLNGQSVHIALSKLDIKGYERICKAALAIQSQHWREYYAYAKKMSIEIKEPSKEERHQEFLLKEKTMPIDVQTAKEMYGKALMAAHTKKLALSGAEDSEPTCQRCGKKISETGGVCKG